MGRAKREGRWKPQRPRGPKRSNRRKPRKRNRRPQLRGIPPISIDPSSLRTASAFTHIAKGLLMLVFDKVDAIFEEKGISLDLPPVVQKGISICEHGVYLCPKCENEDNSGERS